MDKRFKVVKSNNRLTASVTSFDIEIKAKEFIRKQQIPGHYSIQDTWNTERHYVDIHVDSSDEDEDYYDEDQDPEPVEEEDEDIEF